MKYFNLVDVETYNKIETVSQLDEAIGFLLWELKAHTSNKINILKEIQGRYAHDLVMFLIDLNIYSPQLVILCSHSSTWALHYITTKPNLPKLSISLLEGKIAQSCFCSLQYSRSVLNDRFSLGEPIILKDTHFRKAYLSFLQTLKSTNE